ncbi:MAG: hypothetical protein E2600_11525 [Chryseobacterium sp.]|jgi:hypothetical protein|nr:hypothetical protein [Chryseobacterium sp.]
MIKKFPLQFVSVFVLFLLINTSYYWEGEFGIFTFLIFIVLFILFLILSIELIRQLYISLKNRFNEKLRNHLIVFMILCLTLIIVKPTGIINFDKFGGENLLFAQAEGAANCTSTLKVKKDSNKFSYEIICFGIEKTKGTYKIIDRIIYFDDYDKRKFNFSYGKIDKNKGFIALYRSKNDSLPFQIPIIEK